MFTNKQPHLSICYPLARIGPHELWSKVWSIYLENDKYDNFPHVSQISGSLMSMLCLLTYLLSKKVFKSVKFK